ncbi:MAG: hypothetical protein ABW171_08450 [Steroidobacter sp.]
MRVLGTAMKARSGRAFARRCGGWGTAEYVIVMFFGTIGIWRGAQLALTLIREHHREFSWALILPF